MHNISAGFGSPVKSTSSGGFAGTSGKIPTRPIPPSGTSARNAYEKTMREGTGEPQTIIERLTGTFNSPVKSNVKPNSKPKSSFRGSGGYRVYGGSDGSGGSEPMSAKQSLDYYEAPITELYGFNKETAYQEALANTAYRREMNDMRKAGLNPSVIYGSHNSSGADSNILPRSDSGYGGSGGSGGSGRRSRGSGNSGKYVFSGGAYYGIMAGVGAITAMATHNVGAGMAAAGLAGTAMKALNGFLKK